MSFVPSVNITSPVGVILFGFILKNNILHNDFLEQIISYPFSYLNKNYKDHVKEINLMDRPPDEDIIF